MDNAFINAIEQFNESEWLTAVESVLPAIHDVDRNAVQIWFRFYPLDLVRYLESADDVEKAMKSVSIGGDFGLMDKIDSSHHFLYGHRFWPQIRSAVIERARSAEPFTCLKTEITNIAKLTAVAAKTNESLTTAIAAVGLMTLVQTGAEEMEKAPGTVAQPEGVMTGSPDSIVAARAKDDSQGVFGFLKTVDKKFSVDFTASAFAGGSLSLPMSRSRLRHANRMTAIGSRSIRDAGTGQCQLNARPPRAALVGLACLEGRKSFRRRPRVNAAE